MNIDPVAIYERLTQAGEEWVHLDAKARVLEESQKSEFSTIALSFNAKSVAEAEMKARASQQYKDYIKVMCAAREAANEAKVRYDAIKVKWEALRTQTVNMRNEAKMSM